MSIIRTGQDTNVISHAIYFEQKKILKEIDYDNDHSVVSQRDTNETRKGF